MEIGKNEDKTKQIYIKKISKKRNNKKTTTTNKQTMVTFALTSDDG
jgi:hypothetical protein